MTERITILPVFGRKTDVPADDMSLIVPVSEGVFMTHDVGGVNFDLSRTRQCCTKSEGDILWSNSANAQATLALGLFELYDGTNRNHLFVDNGKVYYFDSSLNPQDISGSVTFAKDIGDLYSFIKVGDYAVWADRGETTPYKWKHADAAASKLIASGTEYLFRYLMSFQRRVIGVYTTETDGDISIRWSSAWPTTAITALNFPAANQLYVPNDDPIVGGRTFGNDRAFIYCEDSINELVYYSDYAAPFRCYVKVPKQGAINHQSIISLGQKHYFFNKNYGFCGYAGGQDISEIISQDIEKDIINIDADYYANIVGTYLPFIKKLVWAVPMGGSSTNTYLWFYDIANKQWTIEDKIAYFVDMWRMYDSYTWNDLITAMQAAGYANPTWTNLRTWKGASVRWGDLVNVYQRMVYANTDGKLYYKSGESAGTGNIDGYRIEPILGLAGKHVRTKLQEIWMDLKGVGNFDIDVYHRSGSTVGEIEAESWTLLGSISANSPEYPRLLCDKSDFLHQIKWRTNLNAEKFEVPAIHLYFTREGQY